MHKDAKTVHFNEFLHLMAQIDECQKGDDDELTEVFALLDSDSDGYITKSDIR